MPGPTHADLLAQGVSIDVAQMNSAAVAALQPVMAHAQRELQHELQQWLTKLGPEAVDLKFTVAQLRQAQILLHVAQATAAHGGHKGFPYVAARAVQGIMGEAHVPSKAVHTLNNALRHIEARFADMPPIQIKTAGFIASGEKMVLRRYAASATRYAGQVGSDLRFQFGVGLARGESINQLVNRISKLTGFRGAVDASHAPHAAARMADALGGRYHNWARRLVITELNNAYNHTAREGIKEAHRIDHRVVMVWDAANDLRVCRVCRSLHGIRVDPRDGEFKSGLLQPPAHPYCRCTLVPWWDEMADDQAIAA